MITLDIDGETTEEATIRMIIAYHNLRHFFPRRDIIIHGTQRGYHLIVPGNDGSLEREFELREIFGDDPHRIRIDKYKHRIGSHNVNVLWTVKKGFRVREIDYRIFR